MHILYALVNLDHQQSWYFEGLFVFVYLLLNMNGSKFTDVHYIAKSIGSPPSNEQV